MASSSTSDDSAWHEAESIHDGFVPYHRQHPSGSTGSIPPVTESDYEIPLSRRANVPLKLGQDWEPCRLTPHGEYSRDGRSRYMPFTSRRATSCGPWQKFFDIEGLNGQIEGLPRPYYLDSGADICVISKNCADILVSAGLATRVQRNTTLTICDGTQMRSTSSITVTIRNKHGKTVGSAEFVVIDDEEWTEMPVLSESFIRRSHIGCSPSFCTRRWSRFGCWMKRRYGFSWSQ